MGSFAEDQSRSTVQDSRTGRSKKDSFRDVPDRSDRQTIGGKQKDRLPVELLPDLFGTAPDRCRSFSPYGESGLPQRGGGFRNHGTKELLEGAEKVRMGQGSIPSVIDMKS